MKKQTLQEKCLVDCQLTEATRNQLLNQSKSVDRYKDTSRGNTRFDRKKYSKVINVVKAYNEIDMNKFWKQDILQINIPVVGETDEYTVTLKFEGVVAEMQKNIKNNGNKFEFRTIIQALTKVFNTTDVYVKCTCSDFHFRFAHWSIIKNTAVDDSSKDPGPGKGIVNPKDSKGMGCKHILLTLSNFSWGMKVASVISNYCHYLSEKKPELFLKLVFPKLYGVPAEAAEESDLVAEQEDLDSGKDLINTINDWAKNRGKFVKGSNLNPIYANKLSKEQEEAEQSEKENS